MLVCGFAWLVFVAGTGDQAKLTTPEMFAIVKNLGSQFDKGLKTKNLDLIADIYTPHAKYLAEGDAIHIGKEQIRQVWGEMLGYLKAMVLEPVTVEGTRELLYETGKGKAQMVNSEGELLWFHFKYVNIWKLQGDGSYGLDVDIYKAIAAQ